MMWAVVILWAGALGVLGEIAARADALRIRERAGHGRLGRLLRVNGGLR